MTETAMAQSRRSPAPVLSLSIGGDSLRLDKGRGCLERKHAGGEWQSTPLLWCTVDLLEVLFDQHPRPVGFAEISKGAWPHGLSGAAVRMAEFEAALALSILGFRLVGSERDGLTIVAGGHSSRRTEPAIARAGRLLRPVLYFVSGVAGALTVAAAWIWWRV
ncbi:hypothetical protein AB4099_05390 [Bosea sp. 2KB_26]|uniref:hypothetical protein n=1 Tax=Bosea sp. 2KB_26 TaxID=3237475 RepID=UPI003F91E94F